jgi:hypothetical protein
MLLQGLNPQFIAFRVQILVPGIAQNLYIRDLTNKSPCNKYVLKIFHLLQDNDFFQFL